MTCRCRSGKCEQLECDGPMLLAEIERLREELHYSKGTCELAIKHRDAAEVEIEQLRESDKRHHDLWKAAVDGLRNYKAEIKRLRALWAP